MSGKTIFIIIVTVLVTVILMNNADEIDFWLFGTVTMPKLAILGAMFAIGFISGLVAARPRKKKEEVAPAENESTEPSDYQSRLSDEDRDYIS